MGRTHLAFTLHLAFTPTRLRKKGSQTAIYLSGLINDSLVVGDVVPKHKSEGFPVIVF